jgi:hypothetical protein
MQALPDYLSTSKVVRPSRKRAMPGDNLRKLLEINGPAPLRAKAKALVAEATEVISVHGDERVVCRLSPARALNPDGYVQLSGGQVPRDSPSKKNKTTEQVNVYAHHLLAWYAEEGLLTDWSESISHLCNHPDCLEPKHLIKEPLWKNIRRQSCKGPADCECDETHKCLLPPALSD